MRRWSEQKFEIL